MARSVDLPQYEGYSHQSSLDIAILYGPIHIPIKNLHKCEVCDNTKTTDVNPLLQYAQYVYVKWQEGTSLLVCTTTILIQIHAMIFVLIHIQDSLCKRRTGFGYT